MMTTPQWVVTTETTVEVPLLDWFSEWKAALAASTIVQLSVWFAIGVQERKREGKLKFPAGIAQTKLGNRYAM